MALYGYGVNLTKSIDPSSDNMLDPGLFTGKVRVFQDYATISASSNLNSTDYIVVGGKLPTGAQLVHIKLLGAITALGTHSAALVVGDEGDPDRYVTSTSVTSNAILTGPTAVGGMYYSVTGVTDNYIRISGAGNASILSSGTLKVSILYTVE